MTRRSRPISARARILGAILAVACVGFAIVGSVTFFVQRELVLTEIDERLNIQVERLQNIADVGQETIEGSSTDGSIPSGPPATVIVGIDIDGDDFSTVQEYLDTVFVLLTPERNEASLGIIDGVAVLAPTSGSGFDIAGDQKLIDHIIARVGAGGSPVVGTISADHGSLRYIAIPLAIDGEPQRGIYVQAIDVDAELNAVIAAIATYTIAALAVLVAIAVVGWFVAGRLLSPIRDLRDAAEAITLGDLSTRLAPQGNDDISDLTRTVNSMLDRLEGGVDVQRQLLDDVRHELKTPITIVRGHLELMDTGDVADVESARSIGIAELDRMTRLVDDIDLLATVEGDGFTMSVVDLDELTSLVGELVVVIPGHSWSVESTAIGTTMGDHDRLVQAWLQLADNASKYTPDGSAIQIGSALDETGARLWVRDHGPGIPPASRHRIFRRFDRAHGKRSIGGSGLGLAIVDAIAKGHGGQCVVTDTPSGGATFTIHLPLPSSELPAPVRAGDVVLQREASE